MNWRPSSSERKEVIEREREEDRRKEREREKTTAKGACMSVGTRETRTIHNRSCWRYLRYRWSNRELVRLFSQVHIRRVSWSHSSVCSIQVAVVISLPLRSGRRRRRHFPSTCCLRLYFFNSSYFCFDFCIFVLNMFCLVR